MFRHSLAGRPGSRLARSLLLGAALSAALAAPALANPFETTLANGMKLIVKEDRRAPSVVHMVWYRAGAMDEPDGVSGVAHVLEHMMFKGTKEVGPGEFNRRVAAVGGRDNAFTGKDYTAYFQQVPPTQLPTMMALEADRMKNLVLTDEEFAREIEVVKEERRLRTDDQPRALVFEQLMATAYQAHPYRRPVSGWMPDLEAMQPEDARASVVKAPAELPYLAMTWHVPALRDPANDREAYALDVLAAVLDGYDGARLTRSLVRDRRTAVSVGAGYDTGNRGPALFYLHGVPAAGTTPEALAEALRAEVRRIAEEGISAQELARVKTQAIAAQVYKRDSLMGQAMEIGYLEAAGLSWRDEEKLLEGLRAVTAEDVQAVAKRYFDDASLSTARLDPQPLGDKRPRSPFAAPRH